MTIEERLDRLEAQNRHLRLVLALAVVVGTVGLIMGQAGQDTIADVVRARAFHVVSEDGTPLVKVEYTFGVGVGLAGTVTTINGKGQGRCAGRQPGATRRRRPVASRPARPISAKFSAAGEHPYHYREPGNNPIRWGFLGTLNSWIKFRD